MAFVPALPVGPGCWPHVFHHCTPSHAQNQPWLMFPLCFPGGFSVQPGDKVPAEPGGSHSPEPMEDPPGSAIPSTTRGFSSTPLPMARQHLSKAPRSSSALEITPSHRKLHYLCLTDIPSHIPTLRFYLQSSHFPSWRQHQKFPPSGCES